MPKRFEYIVVSGSMMLLAYLCLFMIATDISRKTTTPVSIGLAIAVIIFSLLSRILWDRREALIKGVQYARSRT